MENSALKWLYKWLPIIMGCHCIAERSFSLKGRPFPICARCTGELLGFILAFILYPIFRPPWYWLLLIMLPGIADGLIQLKSSYESNNIRRLWTGLLMGLGMMSFLIFSFIAVFNLGKSIGFKIKYK